MTKAPAKVFLVDDHPLIRVGLSAVLGTDPGLFVCGDASSPSEAFTKISTTQPDVVITDLNLGSILDGLEFIRALRSRFPKIRILVNTMHDERLYGERTFKAGTNGYIAKSIGGPELIKAVHTVLSGGLWVSSETQRHMMDAYISGKPAGGARTKSPVGLLTDRELEVFRLIGLGYSGRRISTELRVSKSTVESHRAHIKEKLALESPSALMRAAVEWNLESEGVSGDSKPDRGQD